MRHPSSLRLLLSALLLIVPFGIGSAQAGPPDTLVAVVSSDSIQWRKNPRGFEVAVTDGNPREEGSLFTMMLRIPDGGWIPPHWHNTVERVMVIEGTALIGQGRSIDAGTARVLGPGSVVVIPKERVHYAGARGQTVLMVYAVGPFQTTFVDPPTP